MNYLKKNSKLLFPLLLLVLWQMFSSSGFIPPQILPSPLRIVTGIKELVFAGLPPGNSLLLHCLESLLRVAAGFALALIIGVPLGIMVGWFKLLRNMLTPVIETIRPIPPLAWIPLAILWFGIGFKSALFIIFLGCFFPILLSTISGVLSVDTILIDAAKTLGATEKKIFLQILIPAATPSIFTGIRIGVGIGWMTLVAAEFTGVKSGYGLGYMIMVARDIQRPDLVIGGMAAIGLMGYLLDAGLRMLEARALKWR
ncbi:MAG: ABC transporter permease [Proteobacteria bacterium]|nr:ABC transporter permease [Pseudomonadota bacterium]